jgi:hypothetical protein
MNKYTIITIIAIVGITIPFVYSGLNVYSAEKVQFRWSVPQEFNYFLMSNGGEIEFCNVTPWYANFKKFQVDIVYDSENKGIFVAEPVKIQSYSASKQAGIFSSTELNLAQYLLMQLDFQFDGGDARVDPKKMTVIVNIDTPIIGIIPYSTTTTYSGLDFDKIMKGENFNC